MARYCPIQFLPPAENGTKANGSMVESFRVPSAFHLVISIYVGLEKYLLFYAFDNTI